MRRYLSILLIIVLGIQIISNIAVLGVEQQENAYYVSTQGSDMNDGSIEAPFKSLEKARDKVREIKEGIGLPKGGIKVYLRGGEYNLQKSFELTALDSGEPDRRISYMAYNDEEVSIMGGYNLNGADFTRVKDPDIIDRLPVGASNYVKVYDLAAHGIMEYGEIYKSGFGWPSVIPAPELFVDGEVMVLGRFPNSGFMMTETVVNEGFVPRTYTGSIPKEEYINQNPPTFTYSDSRIDKWANESEAWLFGYWKYDWAFDNLKIRRIDTASNSITADHPSYYGVSSGKRFYGYNLLCEVDSENEWYLDRESGKLYLYSTDDLKTKKIQLSTLDKPLFNLTDVDNVSVEGLIFEVSRGDGIQMMDCENNLVADSVFRRLGQKAVEIGNYDKAMDGTLLIDSDTGGGKNNGVVACDIYETGAGGIFMTGGNRQQLIPAGNYAENNHIYDSARIVRTYTPGINLVGVGHRASNNLIYDVPHMAIGFSGNDHIIEYNEIYNACTETSDSGVIYTARDWTYRGNTIKDNYIHDIPTMGGHGSHALYFDDMMSSTVVTGNIIDNVNNMAMLVGGGRDHQIYNNLIMNTGKSGDTSFHLGNRGETWANATTLAPNGTCYVALQNVPYQTGVWSQKYPKLVNIWEDEPAKPKGNVIKDNVFYNSGAMYIVDVARNTGTIENNRQYASGTDIGLVNKEGKNYNLRMDSRIYSDIPGFKPLKFDQMGLKLDQYRTDFSVKIGSFELMAPQNQTVDVNGLTDTFVWEHAEGANKYTVILSKDPEFTTIEQEKTVATNQTHFANLENNQKYYWKVKAFVDSSRFTGERMSESVFSFTSGEQSNFTEDFEAGFGQWNTHKGAPIATGDYAKTGDKSFIIDQDMVVIEKDFGKLLNERVEIWYYDSMSLSTAQLARVDDGQNWIGLGIHTNISSDKYVYRNGAIVSPTTILRSQGWHRLTYDYSSGNEVRCYIDGQLVMTSPNIKAFDYIALGDWWETGGIEKGYFDSISFGGKYLVDKEILEVKLDDITEELGTHFFSINLPNVVEVSLDDGSKEKLTVVWQEGSYDGNSVGKYEITGELVLKEGIVNRNNIKAKIKVHVVDPNAVYLFAESFENGFGEWTVLKGMPVESTLLSKDGSSSFEINQDMVVIEKYFLHPLQTKVNIWHYDSMENVLAQMVRVDDGLNWIGLGINNNVSASNYCIREGNITKETQIIRSQGWHKYTFDYTSGISVNCYIDDQLVLTSSDINMFSYIAIGDWWETGGIEAGYFDQLVVE